MTIPPKRILSPILFSINLINCKVIESVLCTTRAGVPIKNRVCQVGDKGCNNFFSFSSLNFFLKSERNLGGSKSLHHVVLNQHYTNSSITGWNCATLKITEDQTFREIHSPDLIYNSPLNPTFGYEAQHIKEKSIK